MIGHKKRAVALRQQAEVLRETLVRWEVIAVPQREYVCGCGCRGEQHDRVNEAGALGWEPFAYDPAGYVMMRRAY
jgi:hypothetical protein